MKLKQRWVNEFLRKSGDDKIEEENLVVLPFGFFNFFISDGGNTFVVNQAYCEGNNGRKLLNVIELYAKEYGCRTIMFITRRNYRAFERKYGFKLAGYVLEKEVNYE